MAKHQYAIYYISTGFKKLLPKKYGVFFPYAFLLSCMHRGLDSFGGKPGPERPRPCANRIQSPSIALLKKFRKTHLKVHLSFIALGKTHFESGAFSFFALKSHSAT